MEAQRRGRERILTAVLVCPDRDLAQAFLTTVPEVRAFQVLTDLKAYPSLNTLEIRLRQLQPEVLLVDVASDPAAADQIVQFASKWQPPLQVVGLHPANDSAAVVRVLRLGASEFLYSPFEPATQREAAARLRRLSAPEPDHDEPAAGKVVVLSAAKPGAGSSMLATHLAHALKKTANARVLLVDFDLEGGTVAFYLKVQSAYSVVDAMERIPDMDRDLWSEMAVHAGGIDILAAPDLPHCQPVDPARIHYVLEFARSLYDWIIVDAPSAFHRLSLMALSESDKAFLLSTSDLASLHLARRAIGLLTQLGFAKERYEVVVNRLSRKDGIAGSDIEKIFGCPVHAALPNDYFALHRVISLGQPLAPDCELGKAIANLAARVAGLTAAEPRASALTHARPALSQT